MGFFFFLLGIGPEDEAKASLNTSLGYRLGTSGGQNVVR